MTQRLLSLVARLVLFCLLGLGLCVVVWPQSANAGRPAVVRAARPFPAPVPLPTAGVTQRAAPAPGATVVVAPATAGPRESARRATAAGGGASLLGWTSLVARAVLVIAVLFAVRVVRRVRRGGQRLLARAASVTGVVALMTGLTGCAIGPIGTSAGPSPAAYLDGALDWYAAHSVVAQAASWSTLRREAHQVAHGARTTADTYPALRVVLTQLGDRFAWLNTPAQAQCMTYDGVQYVYAGGQALVVEVKPGSAAARAGVRLGDRVVSSNGRAVRRLSLTPFATFGDADVCPTHERLVLRRPGRRGLLHLMLTGLAHWDGGDGLPVGRGLVRGRNAIGVVELAGNWGSGSETQAYATQSVHAIGRMAGVCGWVVDLRHLPGGDLWSYLAAVGPVLGEGTVGSFVYPDGHRERWSYRNGKVYWGVQERSDEDHVTGRPVRLRRQTLPVALLIGPGTVAAGELVAVAFEGRPHAETRLFGQPTAGVPELQLTTTLSDGAQITAGGAYGADRAGRLYRGALRPNVVVAPDWATVGTDRDPVVRAAASWLDGQPACTGRGV